MVWTKPKPMRVTSDIGSTVLDACAILSELQEELQEWLDNLPEHLQEGVKGGEIQEAIDALSNIEEPEVSDELAGITVAYTVDASAKSKGNRRNNAVAMLTSVRETLEALEASGPRDQLASEVEVIIDFADSIDFPRAFG